MSTHWSDRYIGLPWIERQFECSDLAALVQREVFGRDLHLPTEHGEGPFGRSAAISRNRDEFAQRVETPADGDGVLLRVRGHLQHIGVYCLIEGEAWVMHNQKNVGVHRTRLRELAQWGYAMEGYYRWL